MEQESGVFRGIAGRRLAGAGVVLVLAVGVFCLLGLSRPGPVLALPARVADREAAAELLAESDVMTHTVFLPLITRPESEAANIWIAEYYANKYLSGDPVRTVEEVRVDYDWEEGAPSGLPDDGFSIRWSGEWGFEHGEYTFFVDADDGVRLWLDDKLLIDVWTWGIHSETKKTLVEEGPHQVKLEYQEQSELAYVRLHWRRTDLYPRWHGDYYRMPWAETAKLYEQVDSAIQFDWQEGCPDRLFCDGFSIVWEAEPVFVTGTHRIYLYADDGYRLYVDDGKNPVQDGGWFDGQAGGAEDDFYQLKFDRVEQHKITYKFQDRGGLAEARLWIEDVSQPDWTVEYYNNPYLDGGPVHTESDPVIFYDWKWDKPHRSVYSDNFSVRWHGQRHFHAGFYIFGLFVDDGARLWVDGELLVDAWKDGPSEHFSRATYLSSGEHEVIVEYYEHKNEAEIRFWFE